MKQLHNITSLLILLSGFFILQITAFKPVEESSVDVTNDVNTKADAHNDDTTSYIHKSDDPIDDTTPSKEIMTETLDKPTERQIKIGDNTLKEIWEFCQEMLGEMDRLENVISSSQHDLILTAHNMLEDSFKPTKKFLEDHDVCGKEKIIYQINRYLGNSKSLIKGCKRTNYAKIKFQNIVTVVTEYLDQLQLEVTKQVSLCEIMSSEDAEQCFLDTQQRANNYMSEFSTKNLVDIQAEAHTIADQIEGFWLGSTIKALGDIRKTVNKLKIELTSYIMKENNEIDCEVFLNHLYEILTFKPYFQEEDLDVDYLNVKHT